MNRCPEKQDVVIEEISKALDYCILRGREGTVEHYRLLYQLEHARRWHLPVVPVEHWWQYRLSDYERRERARFPAAYERQTPLRNPLHSAHIIRTREVKPNGEE